MANFGRDFGRGFQRTFDPSLLQAQKDTGSLIKETAKTKKKREAFDAIADAIGPEELAKLGLDEASKEAISQSDDPISSLSDFLSISKNAQTIREGQRAETTDTALSNITGDLLSDVKGAGDFRDVQLSTQLEEATVTPKVPSKIDQANRLKPEAELGTTTDDKAQKDAAQRNEIKKTLAEQQQPIGLDSTDITSSLLDFDKATDEAGTEAYLKSSVSNGVTLGYRNRVEENRQFLTKEQLKADVEIEKTWKKEIVKNKKTALASADSIAGLQAQMVASWKAASKEKKDIPSLQIGNLPKSQILKKLTGPVAETFALEGFPFTKAYIGQKVETALALSKIITNSSRIVRDVFKNLLKTLPEDDGIEEDMEAKITQTIFNSFARASGKELTSDERDFLNRRIRAVLDTPILEIPQTAPAAKFKTFQIDGEQFRVPIEAMLGFLDSDTFNKGENIFVID